MGKTPDGKKSEDNRQQTQQNLRQADLNNNSLRQRDSDKNSCLSNSKKTCRSLAQDLAPSLPSLEMDMKSVPNLELGSLSTIQSLLKLQVELLANENRPRTE